jgi:hypothetical protein
MQCYKFKSSTAESRFTYNFQYFYTGRGPSSVNKKNKILNKSGTVTQKTAYSCQQRRAIRKTQPERGESPRFLFSALLFNQLLLWCY